ncbi:SAM-dependent methyltransferase [Saccharopolyspora griseoalba]|uniref:SAM-dependent methyltransferase n=1 Tax=Saccharopolyspora griseoalba TaxID=1431848 RepID=A0ABW2LL36_9PSEU
MDPIALAHADLDFNAPLSTARAAELVASLEPAPGAEAVDLGCGWGELLLQLLAAYPRVRGVGVDLDAAELDRGRRNAEARGLADRVRFVMADAARWSGAAEAVIAVGSSHAWDGADRALSALRGLLRPGGRVLFGEGFREGPLPQHFDVPLSLAELVELAERRGFRVLKLSTANSDEWDDFESRWCGALEKWLLANPDAPERCEVRELVDEHRSTWLREVRGALGFAYLVLARESGSSA